MKKYIQACNLNGSIYGRSTTSKKKTSNKKSKDKKDLTESYSDLYKKQYLIMDKAFHGRK